ncbi:MAG: MaoC family dehydratase N-terminal domain-containing protein, partial [Balneolales bacterium]
TYESWIGKEEIRTDCLAIETIQRYEAFMDRDPLSVKQDDALDPCLHWLYFTPIDQQYTLDSDGHVKKGDFIPPIPSPRRMAAGGKIVFHEVLMLGELTEKTSAIKSIEEKQGSSGKLTFLTVNHKLQQNDDVAIDEDQHIVYMETSYRNQHLTRTKYLDIHPEWRDSYQTDSVKLFRFSALTFNAHRIHYDEPYAQDVEGYPTLVVHGPLIVILLAENFAKHHPERTITEIVYRAVGPMYKGENISLSGQDTALQNTSCRAYGPEGNMAMQAEFKWE